ncbi:MAG: hypothetical protein MUD10_04120 [Candidatus Pacebacteria bacterium]|nr:hypothetical protein [Candidatus Paceibacterota bacterium]
MALVLSLFFSTMAVGEDVQKRGTVYYVGGLLTGQKMIDLTNDTINEKRTLVSEYGYDLVWLDYSRGITIGDPEMYGDVTLAPNMRNTTAKDIYLVTSAGGPVFLYQLVVKKVPFLGMTAFVETTNFGMPWIVDKGINLASGLRDDDPMDIDSPFAQKLFPDSEYMKAIRINIGNFNPDVQVLGNYYLASSKADWGFFDFWGAGSLFKPFPEPKPLIYPIDHEKILGNDTVIEDLFAALNISKLNSSSNFLLFQTPAGITCGCFVELFF